VTDLFLKFLNMSITAGWFVLAVIGARFLLKKAPRWISVALWSLVAVRLIFPFSFESLLSLVPDSEPIPPDILISSSPALDSGIPAVNQVVNPILSQVLSPNPGDSINPLQVLAWIGTGIWILGMAVMGIYAVISTLRIRRRLREAVLLRGNIWICDRIETPFILGIFRPRIYLPSNLSPEDTEFVIAHEKAHLRRRDHWWKPLGFLLLSVYWFQPLLWVAYLLLCRDVETACDERVLKELGAEVKKPYSTALLRCSVPRRTVSACPLAFGEVGVKSRIKSVLNYKKPTLWVILAALILCVILAVCFLTDPIRLSDSMKAFMDRQLMDYHSSGREGAVGFLDCEVLSVDRSADETTVYMWVLWEEYQREDDALKVCSGAHIFTVMRVKASGSGYELEELWQPRDGSYWASDIREKVPWYLFGRATDSQRYIGEQKARLEQEAKEYFGLQEPEPEPGYQLLKNVEMLTLQETLDTTVQVMTWDGTAYNALSVCPSVMLTRLGNLQISAGAASPSRSEDRFRDHTLVLQTAEDLRSPLSSRVMGLYVCFNGDFSQVWLTGNLVKPTLTYGVRDPEQAKALWEEFSAWKDASSTGGVRGPENVTVNCRIDLRAMYPQYFGLSTEKGLTVYVWQYGPNLYHCGLLPGKPETHGTKETWELEPVLLSHMRSILETYGLPQTEICVVAFRHPHSSYLHPLDDAYRAELEQRFWAASPLKSLTVSGDWAASAVFDPDADGVPETVGLLALSQDSYAVVLAEDGATPGMILEQYTVFTPHRRLENLAFVPAGNGWYRLSARDGESGKEILYKITCRDGYVFCNEIEE